MSEEIEDFMDRHIDVLENEMHWFFLIQLAAAQAKVSVEELMRKIVE